VRELFGALEAAGADGHAGFADVSWHGAVNGA